MKYQRILIPSLVAFIGGALLSPSGGRGGLARNVRELEVKFGAAKATPTPDGVAVHELIGRTGDTRLSHLLSALQEPSALKRGHDLFLATQGLSGADIVDMMEAAKKLPTKYGAAMREALVARWFDVDPTAAEAWMRTRPTDDRAWKAWAAHFPERAIAEVQAHPHGDGDWRTAELLRTAIRAMPGVTDSKSEAEKLLALPAGPVRNNVLGNAVADWAQKDPEGAFAFAHQLPLGPDRNHATGDALRQIAKKDPMKAMQLANEMLPEYWKGNRVDVPADIAVEVAKKDFTAARQWVEQMPMEQRGRVAQPLAAKLVETDPARALEWGSANGVDLSSIMGGAMRKSTADTLRWIEQKPEGPDRTQLLEQALSSSGNGAATFGGDSAKFNSLLGQLPPDSQMHIANRLGNYNGGADKAKKIWDWIGTLDDESVRLEAITAVSYSAEQNARWNPKNSVSTPELSDVASHDAAIIGQSRGNPKPEDSAQMLLQINDPQTRQNQFNRAMPDWLHRSPDAAEAWLKQNGSFSQQQIDAWKEEGRWAP
jgi:hypothetical protein